MGTTASRRSRGSALAAWLLLASFLPAGPGGVAAAERRPDVPLPQTNVTTVEPQVLDVAAGASHSCAIRADGTIGCWGDDYAGQSSPPDGIFTAIFAGGDATCAIRSNGSVACWGAMTGFQPTGTFKAVSIGAYHACAIRADDTVECWGRANEGQTTPPAGTFKAISAGTFHTCGIRSDGLLVCWGGLPEPDGPPVPTADTLVALDGSCAIRADGSLACWDSYEGEWSSPLAGTFIAVSGTCAIRTDETLACWGGYGPPAGTFIAVSASDAHACAIHSDNTLACWGYDGAGQVTPRPTPSIAAEVWRTTPTLSLTWGARSALVPVASYELRYRRVRWDGKFGTWKTLLSDVTATSATFETVAGYTYCYAVRARDLDGNASHWTNQAWYAGQSGCTATPVDDRVFTRSKGWAAGSGDAFYGGTRLRSTKADATLTMSVRAGWIALVATTCPTCGKVQVSFGENMSRTLSLTSPTRMDQQILPVASPWEGPGHAVTIRVVTSGKPVIIDGLLATRNENAPAWADAEDPPTPAVAGTTRPVNAISAGDNHTCAVKPDGTLACWGSNAERQSSVPPGAFTAVSSGGERSCGIRADGTAACWGGRSPWSPEDPSTGAPGRYAAISTGYDISSESEITCAIRDDGHVVCWGDTSPDGAFVAVSVGGPGACAIRQDGTIACWQSDYGDPFFPPEGTFTALSVGRDHACAIRTDQTLMCWGSDSEGQATPPEGAFADVSAGDVFACGLRTDGTLACWGDNRYLQSSPPAGTFTALDVGRRHACAIRTDGGLACWGQDRSGQVTPTPTGTVEALPEVTVKATVPVRWGASSLSPIVSYDLRYRSLRWGGTWGPWTAWRTGTTTDTASLPATPGRYTCVEVRVRDSDGARSLWSGMQCTTAPFDDRALDRSGRWRELSGDAYYRGTALRTSSRAAKVTLANVPEWAGISLVATTCRTCGTVRVAWDSWAIGTFSLYSATTKHRQLIRISEFDDEAPNYRMGLTIRVVSSNKKVVVDGLAVVGPPLSYFHLGDAVELLPGARLAR